MNNQLSVVIICRNEAHIIGRTIAAALLVTNDVIVVDSGSTDGTQEIVRSAGARLLETTWDGYGKNKNKGVDVAQNNWILSIDADEVVDNELIETIGKLTFSSENVVYNIPFRVFLGSKMIRYGEWASDAHIRLYNRQTTRWNEAAVHENLLFGNDTKLVTLKGHILHYTSGDLHEFGLKMVNYAVLNATKYHTAGKKSGWSKRYLSAPFSFIKNYFFRLGFLDGEAGYTVAKMNAFYTWLKYARLHELNRRDKG